MRSLFISKNLIGDGLYISGALRSWLKKNYKEDDEVYMQTLPDHIAPLYEGMVRDLMPPEDFHTVFERPALPFDFEHTFDVTPVFQLSHQKKMHISECYAELLGVELEGVGNSSLKPTYIPDYIALDVTRHSEDILVLANCVLISMYSMSCSSRGNPPGPPNKMLPWEKWKPMIELLRKEFPSTQIRTLGGPEDSEMTPFNFRSFLAALDIVSLHAIRLNRLAVIMKNAKLLVTIDNGMGHLAASQELPTFLMYPRALMPHYILPVGNPYLDWVHMDPNTVSAKSLAERLAYRIRKLKEAGR